MSAPHSPTAPASRITAIDTLRGFALLGILIMNIQGFSMAYAAYSDPSAQMDLSGINWWVWALGHAFADLKFMAIFSMLFGAGILLLTERREAQGGATFGLHYTRNFWLLIFGLIHAYFIWYGDILVTYALAGFLVYWARQLSASWLIALGICALSVAPGLSLLGGWAAQMEGASAVQQLTKGFTTSPAQVTLETWAYLGSWADAHAMRVSTTLGMHAEAIPFYLIWRAGGLMLIGMALYKLGVLTAARSAAFYTWLILIGFAIGLPLVTLSVLRNSAAEWAPIYSQFGTGLLYNYIGSIAIAHAYIGIVMRLALSGKLLAMQTRLASVGRMAFTNYILQSLICTFIFYGFGLGLFGSVERWGQVLVVLAIWALQLLISPIWLRHFRFGPLEWFWRTLTYLKLQPMRR